MEYKLIKLYECVEMTQILVQDSSLDFESK